MGKAPQLKSFLEKTFSDAGGSLSFERFMELALYDPDFGYYSANICDVGGDRADFSTWATLANLGKPVANWIRSEISHFGWDSEKVHLIEMGAGDGSLAASVLKEFGWLSRRKIQYHIVDRSGPLREIQNAKLKGKKVIWHESMADALSACAGKAIIFSNELVDAFPVRWLRWNGECWEEISVCYSPDNGLSESFQPVEIEIDWPCPPPGQRIELHDSYYRWQAEWLPDFKAGSLLTIDYGSPDLESIYRGKKQGSLRAYHRQQRIEGPGVYRRFGQQDLTSDVDFSRLVECGRRYSLHDVSLENQLDFFNRFEGDQSLSTEAAEAFQVLHQRIQPVD